VISVPENQVGEPGVATIRLSSLAAPSFNLDAKHYQEEFTLALARVLQSRLPVEELSSHAAVFVPGRVRLVTVANPSAGAPYLRAHDVFNVRPRSGRHVARERHDSYEQLMLRKGMILTPSSGRNLGPVAYVSPYLAQFAMTDILRIVPRTPQEGLYLVAYLLTPTGQALIRRGRSGTNVDHLVPAEVEEIPVIWPKASSRQKYAKQVEHSEELLDQARRELDQAERQLHHLAGLPNKVSISHYLSGDGTRAFSVRSRSLTLRLDAQFYDPTVVKAAREVSKSGGVRLDELAELQMLGRYKRYYVDEQHGRPILSGRQLLQLRPVSLRFISDRSFTDVSSFVLHRGWTVFTCDGRSEEALGSPAFVHSGWQGWLASNHVMRAIPKPGIRGGYLYLALCSELTQVQLKARATGSVIDGLDPLTIGEVIVPKLDNESMDKLAQITETAWEKIARSQLILRSCVQELEAELVQAYEM
jgi:hypothetical protein